jgi:hypothetical protein
MIRVLSLISVFLSIGGYQTEAIFYTIIDVSFSRISNLYFKKNTLPLPTIFLKRRLESS